MKPSSFLVLTALSITWLCAMASFSISAEQPPRDVLAELLKAEGEQYSRLRDGLLADDKALAQVLKHHARTPQEEWLLKILREWSQHGQFYRDRLQGFAYAEGLHRTLRSSIGWDIPSWRQLVKNLRADRGARFVPLMLEFLWKSPPIPLDLNAEGKMAWSQPIPLSFSPEEIRRGEEVFRPWRRFAAWETIRLYADASLVMFCVDQIAREETLEAPVRGGFRGPDDPPPTEPDLTLVDMAVNTAITLGRRQALAELEKRAENDGEGATKYRTALLRMKQRLKRLLRGTPVSLTALSGGPGCPSLSTFAQQNPFDIRNMICFEQHPDLGLLYIADDAMKNWQEEWTRRIILSRWEYGIGCRTNIYGKVRSDLRLGPYRKSKPPPEKIRQTLRRHAQAHGKKLVPFVVCFLWKPYDVWVVEPWKKIAVIDILKEYGDHTIVPPMAEVLTQQEEETVVKSLIGLIAKVANDETVQILNQAIEQADIPEAKGRLQRALDAVENR